MKDFLPIIYSALILCIFTVSNIWLYQQIQGLDGNIRHFLGLPILIFLYLVIRHIFILLVQKKRSDKPFLISLFILKFSELSFLFTLSSFTLNSYFLLIFVVLLHCIGIMYSLYLSHKNQMNLVLLTPHYDLIVYCILSVFIAHIPQLHSQYTWLNIGIIKLTCDTLLVCGLLILAQALIRTLLTKPSPLAP